MVILYRILDLCGVNAYVIFSQHSAKNIQIGDFLKKFARSLVIPHIQRRAIKSNRANYLKMTLKRVLGCFKPLCKDYQ
ncbi:unnamed protein product [Parnassius mnemosyne]|uniref:Uncharacterized protein n=1 Tax=Parnassius mnemosyne TaxID=213953 RepID=A0AAV1M8U7_9NEOP